MCPRGTVSAPLVRTVPTVRAKLSALILIVALTGATSVREFAGEIHAICAARHHDCGKTATIAACCCGDHDGTSNQAGPVQSRIQVHPSLTFGAAPAVATDALTVYRTNVRPQTSPPRASPLDRPTLFASLLI
jgi:hypothetical protein